MSASAEKLTRPRFDAEAIAREFPILARKIHGKPIPWSDFTKIFPAQPRQTASAN
jgi:hypothetical protein